MKQFHWFLCVRYLTISKVIEYELVIIEAEKCSSPTNWLNCMLDKYIQLQSTPATKEVMDDRQWQMQVG